MADSPSFQRLRQSLQHASQYPRNCLGVETQEHTIRALEDQLNKRSSNLFSQEGRVHFLEVYRIAQAPHAAVVSNASELERHLLQSMTQQRPDPRQRYIFVHASDSREPLRVTRQMLLQILAYHQVDPSFLEFVFPFGKKTYERDSYFSGFRSSSVRASSKRSLQIHAPLHRSGRHLEMCYHLKSVERSSSTWAIRDCSIHHKFDLVFAQSTWIVVKANSLIRKAIEQKIRDDVSQIPSANDGAAHSPLARSLSVHRSICSWTGDNWHWYISDLESQLFDKTREVLVSDLEEEFSQETVAFPADECTTVESQQQQFPHERRESLSQKSGRFMRKALRRLTSASTWRDDQTAILASPMIGMTDFSRQNTSQIIEAPFRQFPIGRIQEIQDLEDQTNKALFILKANCRVIRSIQEEYASMIHSGEDVVEACKPELEDFQRHLDTSVHDQKMLQTRLETLLRMAADRKSLVRQILQYRSTQATQMTALRGQGTAESMERMTRQMHRMTEKTVQQTASMNIITFVTLLFLPGTFISTLMSTPIVVFDEPTHGFSVKNIGFGALQMYLVVSLPLFCLTVLLWIGWYFYERRNHRKLGDEEYQQDC